MAWLVLLVANVRRRAEDVTLLPSRPKRRPNLCTALYREQNFAGGVRRTFLDHACRLLSCIAGLEGLEGHEG